MSKHFLSRFVPQHDFDFYEEVGLVDIVAITVCVTKYYHVMTIMNNFVTVVIKYRIASVR